MLSSSLTNSAALSEWTEQELVGKPLQHVLVASRGEWTDDRSTGVISPATDRSMAGNTGYRCRDGSIFRGETTSFPLRGDDGHIQGYIHIIHNVSDRHRHTDELIGLIAFIAAHSVHDEVDVSRFLDLGCRYFRVELGMFSTTDGDLVEAVGGNFAPIVSEQQLRNPSLSLSNVRHDGVLTFYDDRKSATGLFRVDLDILLVGLVQGAEQCHGTLCFAHRSGIERPLDDCQRSVFHLMMQWLAVLKDTQTIQRSYEDINLQLRKNEERFRDLYEKTPAMLHSIDESGRIASISNAWLAAMGYERDEVIGRPSTDFLTAGSKRYADEVAMPAYCANGSCRDVDYQFVTKDGAIRDIELSAISECDDDGNFVRSLAVLLDVTERKQVERVLTRKSEALERSNEDLKQIAQIVSHDLQEPLRRVMTYCGILKEDFGAALPEGASEIADVIQSGGRRLRLVVNDLLAYVRIREQLDRAFEPVDMSAVICHALDDLNDEIAARNVRIDVAHLPLVWGRAPLLKMVCHHLLSNAIKYRGEETPVIDITVDDAGDLWQFAVADRGMGVEARFADRIFDIFQRLHHNDECEGSGAGLAICRLVIQRCGGNIWLDRSYQGGARFHFTLPKDKPDALEPLSGRPLVSLSGVSPVQALT